MDPELRAAEFLIVPVEIVVGSARTIRKMPEKSPTRSSINILPRCSKQTASEQKRILRKLVKCLKKYFSKKLILFKSCRLMKIEERNKQKSRKWLAEMDIILKGLKLF